MRTKQPVIQYMTSSLNFQIRVAVFTGPVEIGPRTAVLLRSGQPVERGGEAFLDRDWPLRWASGWLGKAKTARQPRPRGARRLDSDGRPAVLSLATRCPCQRQPSPCPPP